MNYQRLAPKKKEKGLLPQLSANIQQSFSNILPSHRQPALLDGILARNDILSEQCQLMMGMFSDMGAQMKQQHSDLMLMLKRVVKRLDKHNDSQHHQLGREQQKQKNHSDSVHDARQFEPLRYQSISQASKLSASEVEHNDIQPSMVPVAKPPLKPQATKNQSQQRLAVVIFEEEDCLVEYSDHIQHLCKKKTATVEQLLESISVWVAKMLDLLCRQAFKAYYSRHLSEAETKAYFTHCFIRNFDNMTSQLRSAFPRQWDEHRLALVNHFESQSQSTLSFMLVRYPQKRKTYFNESTRQAIPTIDQSDDPQFDILRSLNFNFTYSCQRKQYHSQVKQLINSLIENTRKWRPVFQQTMKGVFTVEGRQLKNLIGAKLRADTPGYSSKEIAQIGIEIKSPQVLRILIKWIEQLEKRLKGLSDSSLLTQQFNLKGIAKSGYMSKSTKEQIKSYLSDARERIANMRTNFTNKMVEALGLLPEFVEKYSGRLRHIPQNSRNRGLIAYAVSQLTESLSIKYLIQLLEMLLSAESSISKEYEGESESNTYQLLSFNVSDLLRCKCSGSLQDIQKVYQSIRSHPDIQVYRVKNRLDTGNRDFLLNLRLKGCPLLCEVQLAVADDKAEARQAYLDHFNHFVYELARAKYGSLAQAVMINTHLTDEVSYFDKQVTDIAFGGCKLPIDLNLWCGQTGEVMIRNWQVRQCDQSLICHNCARLIRAYQSNFPVFEEQSESNTRRKICGECVLESLDQQQKLRYLLGKTLSRFMQRVDSLKISNLPNILCAYSKLKFMSSAEIYQLVRKEDKTVYVPTFYALNHNPRSIDVKTLSSQYYHFILNPNLKVVSIGANSTARALLNNKGKPLSLRNTLPQEALEEIGITDRRLLERPVEMVFGFPFMSVNNLWGLDTIDVVLSEDASTLLVLNDAQNNQELQRMAFGCRTLRKPELDKLRVLPRWNLDNSNLGAPSLSSLTDSMDMLEEASLQGNDFRDLEFISSRKVATLNLNYNSFRMLEIRPQTFPSLTKLCLSHNMIDNLKELSHSKLKFLQLGYNRLVELNSLGWNLPQLEELYLQYNQLTEVDISGLPRLRVLALDTNSLSELALPSQCHLEKLFASNNKLTCLDWQSVGLSSLVQLNLGSNLLTSVVLPHNLPQLEYLELQKNSIQCLDISQCRMPRLKRLEIPACKLQQLLLPAELPQLEALRIYKNRLTLLDLDRTLPKLQVIAASFNRIKQVKFNPSMKSLSVLSIHMNVLSSLDLTQLNNSRLEQLHIDNNYIQQIRFASQQQAASLQSIRAAYNPFRLPLPCNIQLVPHKLPESLKELSVGAPGSKIRFVRWLLRQYSVEDRQNIYTMAEQKAQKGLQLSDTLERIMDTDGEDLTETAEMEQASHHILQLLLATKRVPNIYERLALTYLAEPAKASEDSAS